MSFHRQENDVLYLLGLWIYFYDISRERIPRKIFISDDKFCFVYGHLDYLIVDGGIIEISSKQKEDQYRTDDIIIKDGKDEYAGKNDSEYQVPYLISLKFFSVIDENVHTGTIRNKTQNIVMGWTVYSRKNKP